jgi:diguanylate cyclase (GGDEF)-like protein
MNLRTSFRRKLLMLALVPLALAEIVTIFAVMRTVERDVNARANESLRIGADVIGEYLDGRGEQLHTSVQVLASDFGLKEAAATNDADTIRSVLENHSLRVDADIAALLDLEGRLIASTNPSLASGQQILGDVIDDYGRDTDIQSTKFIGDVGYHVFAVPLRAPVPIAWVVLGFRLDINVVEQMAVLTGLDVAMVAERDGVQLLASSTAVRETAAKPGNLLPGAADDPVYVIEGSNTDYLATATPFIAGVANGADVEVVIMRSLTDAMAPYVEARRGLIVFGVFLLGVVALCAVWLSGSIARPLNVLTEAVRSMMSGDYSVKVQVSSNDEVGELASSFNAMTAAIAEREERISHQALHHRLTDLPNYNFLTEQLTELIGAAAESGAKVFVLSIRLSRIGAISSTLGHSASDEVIRLAARALRANLEPSEILGHIGAEEFALLIPGGETDSALECAEKLRGILASGVTLGRVNIHLQSTFGVASYPEHGTRASEILRKASIARSEAETTDEQVGFYQSGRENYHVRQLRIVNDLRSAFRRNQVQVWYQPKISLPSGAPCGAEALVRWEHHEYGWLSPDEFIPAAEEAGTIVHLTRFVLGDAIARCREWHDAGHAMHVSVNISARDLCDDYLPYYVLQLLKEQDLRPNQLTLEVTENSVMQQLGRAMTVLECLRDVGVRISMDDFGTGQSSLAQLRNIPMHELKIDKSFVMTLPDSPQDESIVRTTLELAHSLGLEVVAEGVENEETLRFLSSSGCEQAQGFFLSKPIPPKKFLAWLRTFEPVAYPDRRGALRPIRKEA